MEGQTRALGPFEECEGNIPENKECQVKLLSEEAGGISTGGECLFGGEWQRKRKCEDIPVS